MTRSRPGTQHLAGAGLGLVLIGCGLSVTGVASDILDGGGDADPGLTDSSDGSTVASDGAELGPDADAAVAADSALDALDDVTVNPASSCRDVKTTNPLVTSGNQTIVIPGRGDVLVFCEMNAFDGGFTLVGRSASSGTGSMGWTTAVGSVGDVASAYSLDARGLVFAEVMLAEWQDGALVKAVRVNVPPDFIVTYAMTTLDLQSVPGNTTISTLGSCSQTDFTSQTQMVHFMGRTSTTNRFFIRDMAADANFGLRPDRFHLDGSGCTRSMDLDNKRGAIYVR